MPWDSQDLDQGPIPLWHQVAQRLRAAIEADEFSEGDALPSESALNHRFGVSRTTARAALDHLENEGLIVRRSGRGSIVLAPRVDQPLNLLASFGEDMRARGLRPSYQVLTVQTVRANAELAATFGVQRSTRVVMIRRLLCADERPIALSASWLAPHVLNGRRAPSVAELEDVSLYVWLERECGARIAAGSQFIEAAAADSELAERLHVPSGHPLLVARRTSRTAAGVVVEHVVSHYRSDRYRFKVEMVRP
jgi:GntR family transcriptional regulator